jgi:hypothetical protein
MGVGRLRAEARFGAGRADGQAHYDTLPGLVSATDSFFFLPAISGLRSRLGGSFSVFFSALMPALFPR